MDILLVEDNHADILIIENMLKISNIKFEIDIAETLCKAIEKIEKKSYDVILLDLILSDSDGLNTFENIYPSANGVPIIIVSIIEDETTAIRSLKMGAQDYLVKGKFDAHLLVRSIEYSIERKKTEEEINKKYRELDELNERLKKEIKKRKASEKKLIESALRKRDLQLRAIIDNSASMIFAKDLEGRYILANKLLNYTFGFENKELFSKTSRDIFPEELANDLENQDKEVLANQCVVKREHAILINGEKRTFLTLKFPLYDENGNIYAIAGTAAEISERIAAEEKLKESLASRDKFFSIISHDLKAPFVGLIGIAEVLQNNIKSLSPEEIQEFSKVLYTSALNLLKLLENLLQWSKLQRGMIEFSPERFTLYEIIELNISFMVDMAKMKQVSIINNVRKDLFVFADMSMTNTIIRNLLSNGIKFSNEGGKIIFETADIDEEGLELRVIDNGIGIDKAVCESIFRIDFRHTTQGTAGEKGTGLGLILCKELIERQGGMIKVESEADRGSVFSVTFKKAMD